MPLIQALDQNTINQIAAGEVVDRPSSIVKELMENAIDAGATAVTVEIREGGIRYIRITDNGCGIAKDQIPLAFKRHTTSKIRTAEDLLTVSSLGFRGEALSSIAAISHVELITKTKDALTGVSYCIAGGEEQSMTEIGAPDGTTFLIQNVFYNTPARLKFLKSPTTEGNYINELVERMALANPSVAIHFINNGQTRLQTTGNGDLKEVIYIVFGREIAANIVPIHSKGQYIELDGFLGKPVIARGNRSFENYFINGRYIKNNIIAKAIETAYQPYMMQHRYPFVTLHLKLNQEMLDVNVHPAKMEVRFRQERELFQELTRMLAAALSGKEFIPDVQLVGEQEPDKPKGVASVPEPFEKKRSQLEQLQELTRMGTDRSYGSRMNRDYVVSSHDRIGRTSQREETRGTVTEYRFDFGSGRAQVHKKQIEEELPFVTVKQQESVNGEKQKSVEQEQQGIPEDREVNMEEAGVDHAEDLLTTAVVQNDAGETYDTSLPETHAEGDQIQSTDAEQTEGDQIQSTDAEQIAETGSYTIEQQQPVQQDLFGGGVEKEEPQAESRLLSKESRSKHQLIGQLFDTYWLIQFEDKLFIMDQHAAHEKVLYERTMKSLADRTYTSQQISPPVLVSLSVREQETLQQHMSRFTDLGFEIEFFGGREYAIRAVPDNLFGLQDEKLFLDLLDSLSEESGVGAGRAVHEKVASMSCKAAVKGKMSLSFAEANALIDELLTLDNPYACPHGRPTIISMSRYELEKKFKRIV